MTACLTTDDYNALRFRALMGLRARQGDFARDFAGQPWLRAGDRAPASGVYAVTRSRGNTWLDASRRVLELRLLKDNWDGYGAKPIPAAAWGRAYHMLGTWRHHSAVLGGELAAPFVAPCGNGSVQFEWEVGRRSLEIEIHADIHNRSTWVASEETDGEPIYSTGTLSGDNSNQIKRLVRWLVTDK